MSNKANYRTGHHFRKHEAKEPHTVTYDTHITRGGRKCVVIKLLKKQNKDVINTKIKLVVNSEMVSWVPGVHFIILLYRCLLIICFCRCQKHN